MDNGYLKDKGFGGFYTIKELYENNCSQIPESPGIYVILRNNNDAPIFLDKSTGGFFKGKDPTLEKSKLNDSWVKEASVVYIGKAGTEGGSSTLHKRIKTYLAFGRGSRAAHWGGRYIWQLADSNELVVSWKTTRAEQARPLEESMISDFITLFGKRPYANLKD